MYFLREFLDKVKPHFKEGGKLSKLHSVFDGFETFLFVPNATSKKNGTHIHDPRDSKRSMVVVVLALIPALLFGMYNVGYQHFLAIGQEVSFFEEFLFGILAVLPLVIVAYGVGLGIEFIVAQMRGHEIQEGFLVSGMIIPLIVPVDTPLWMVAVATAFSVIFVKEVFGGTGMNIFNVALVTRAFLFFAYPSKMSGDSVWVRTSTSFGYGEGTVIDSFSGSTPLGQAAIATGDSITFESITGKALSAWDMFLGLIPGSIGETSVLAILLGAVLLLVTGVASWKIMLSVFAGGSLMGLLLTAVGTTAYSQVPFYEHLLLGGFAFGAVFMATDPVTASRTECGKWIYGFFIGVLAILIRVVNPAYPEGMMLAILIMNMLAAVIDYYVIQANVNKRLARSAVKK